MGREWVRNEEGSREFSGIQGVRGSGGREKKREWREDLKLP